MPTPEEAYKTNLTSALGKKKWIDDKAQALDQHVTLKDLESFFQSQLDNYITKEIPSGNLQPAEKKGRTDFLKQNKKLIAKQLAIAIMEIRSSDRDPTDSRSKLISPLEINRQLGQTSYKDTDDNEYKGYDLVNKVMPFYKYLMNERNIILHYDQPPENKHQAKYLAPQKFEHARKDTTDASQEEKEANKKHRASLHGKFEEKLDTYEAKLQGKITKLAADAKHPLSAGLTSALKNYYSKFRVELTETLARQETTRSTNVVASNRLLTDQATDITKLFSKANLETFIKDTITAEVKKEEKESPTASDAKSITTEEKAKKDKARDDAIAEKTKQTLAMLTDAFLNDQESHDLRTDFLKAVQEKQDEADAKLTALSIRKAADLPQFQPAGTPSNLVVFSDEDSPDHLYGAQEYQGTHGLNGIKMNLTDEGVLHYRPCTLSYFGSRLTQMDEARSAIAMYFQHPQNTNKSTLHVTTLPSASFIESFISTMEKHFSPPPETKSDARVPPPVGCRSPKKITFSEKTMQLMSSVFTDNTAEKNAIINRVNEHNAKVDAYIESEKNKYGIQKEVKNEPAASNSPRPGSGS